ncbi:uncharacterized protein CHSO_0336 [Chryseobacterium sp. StRB126]|uniref:hypothetical protein n=1 Tax=Chryseobacterium sp. StRB126 TaxID=878220 RepID=UPI0004E997FE|nr:hypothetical protein [Chryseobacterium sp. StRB126]BAP29373.1 uncharacterized protein CHSO_0336 [Chryseobacterium sp. StRB126]
MKTKQELKQYFENGDIPKQEEFWDWQDSYWHKEEKIPSDKLAYDFSQKADLVNGVVPASQLPSYVDDVLEFDSLSNLPQQGESGKIYITKDSNKIYRWTGARYIDITQGELGTLQSVTDRGNETTKSIKVQGINYGGSSQVTNILISDNVENLNKNSNNTISIGINTRPYGTDNIVIGNSSNMFADSSSIGNTIIGHSSYSNSLYSNENTVIGYSSFNNAKNSNNNTIIGSYAGSGGGDKKSLNIILGQSAGSYLSEDSRNNIIIGNNSHFNNSQLQNSLYLHNNNSGNPTTLSDALISGNFVDRYVNLNGKFSITPDQIPTADSSYTKNIVARPDGTFGWEDKVFSEFIPLAGTSFKKPVTGDILIKGGGSTSLGSTRLSSGNIFCSDVMNNGTFVDPSSIKFLEAGTGTIAEISPTGITAGESYLITSNGSNPRGISGASDYTYNVKDLDYIQKKYADKQHSYTKEEVKTEGLWIDNKPIYRKTVVFSQIPDEGIIRIDKIFEDMEMIVSNQMFTEWYDMKADFSGNQLRGEAFISLQKEYVQFLLKSNPNYNYSAINSFTLTLEYTKKSDLPVV